MLDFLKIKYLFFIVKILFDFFDDDKYEQEQNHDWLILSFLMNDLMEIEHCWLEDCAWKVR
jgi:hypothetical protein